MVRARLQYLSDDLLYKAVKPLQITPAFKDYERRSNVILEAGPPEIINDVRGREAAFSLDSNGFKYVKAPTEFKDWTSQPSIAQHYLPAMETLLKEEVEGCDEILFYDARIRQAGDEGVRVNGVSFNPFARQVHTDNTEKSVIAKIRALTEMKAEYLLSGRARIINIWRPIKHPVYDNGLAIADGGKLLTEDVIECDRCRADNGEYWDTMGVVQYRPGFEWYYMSEQAEEDVLLFKNYDSATNVQARCCLHTAFDLPAEGMPAGASTRESIEVRALIFTYPKDTRKPLWMTLTEHPLAITLAQGELKQVEDEHSITDRPRTDIDEGKEIKDAVLLYRRQEIRRLEKIRDTLSVENDALSKRLCVVEEERDQAKAELVKAQMEAGSSVVRAHKLGHEKSDLQWKLSETKYTLSRVMAPQDIPHVDRPPYWEAPQVLEPSEADILKQSNQGLRSELERWQAGGMAGAYEYVSKAWQSRIDELVRLEREKDKVLIPTLQNEIRRLESIIASGSGTTTIS